MSNEKKKEMTPEDASRIQSAVDKGTAKESDEDFKKRAQSSGDKNANKKEKQ